MNIKKAVILSGISWNTTLQRHHIFSKYLKKMGYDVYFIESIPSSKFNISKLLYRVKAKFKKNKNKISNEKDGIKVINMKFINPHSGLFACYNNRKSKKLVKIVGTNVDLVINYLPINTTEFIIEKLSPKKNIYDCVRDFESWGGYSKNVKNIERRIVERSDDVFVDSYYLKEKLFKNYNCRKIKQFLPTVDEKNYEILSQCKLPEKIIRILYFGAVSSHVNIEILNKLSESGFEIHIVGEVDNNIKLNKDIINHGFMSDLNLLAKTIVENADAIIIPYKGNMNGVIPAKLMQSLSSGLPVFISDFYDSRVLSDYVYVFENMENLLSQIRSYSILTHDKISEKMKIFSAKNVKKNQFINFCSAINE